MSRKYVVMLGTATTTKGGVAAAISAYIGSALSQRWPILHVPTHTDGGWGAKLRVAARAYARFVGLLLRGRVGIVHVHSASDASFWRKSTFVALALATRRPVIFHLHGGGFVDFYNHRAGFLGRRVIRLVLNRVSRIVVLSDRWAKRMSVITTNRCISVIPNMVALPTLPDPGAGPRSGRELLFLGRLETPKGIYDLLDAVAQVAATGAEVKLRLAGEGETERVRTRARELGVERSVEFLGWIDGATKAQALQRAAIFVLPSYIENMPVSMLEAMAAGVPVVATTVGGIPDVVRDGVQGRLVAPGDVAGLARAIRELIEHEALRRAMGEAGRQLIEREFSGTAVVPRIDALYRELWAEGARDIPSRLEDHSPGSDLPERQRGDLPSAPVEGNSLR
ncbi:MAG: glycosyltransferase family 4 protein [Sulfurifustaceae bacterium]